jgi:glycosyltransferase involved in cell wall biosynthesis
MFARVLKIDPSRIDLIPNGSEIPRTAEGISGISGPKPLILSVGRLEEYKGHHRAVRAMPMILKSLPAARMLIVGRGPFEKNLRKLIVDLGLEESVSITSYGGEERTEYSDLLRMADLVVLLSEYEAHPIAVMEAVAVGTPVVGAATSGFIELGEERVIDVVDLESGQDEIAQAMITALARGRREPQCYTWSQCASGIQSIYERVLQRGSASK